MARKLPHQVDNSKLEIPVLNVLGMNVSDAKRLKELETENARLKRLLAEAMLENEVTKEALRKKW